MPRGGTADTHGLGPCTEGCGGSNPPEATFVKAGR